MAPELGLEPRTYGFRDRRSDQLRYSGIYYIENERLLSAVSFSGLTLFRFPRTGEEPFLPYWLAFTHLSFSIYMRLGFTVCLHALLSAFKGSPNVTVNLLGTTFLSFSIYIISYFFKKIKFRTYFIL